MGRLSRRAILLFAVYVGSLIVLSFLENTFIFPAPRFPAGDWQPEGLTFQDVSFVSGDGVALHGWFVDHPAPTAVVLYLHGNGDCLGYFGPYLKFLHDELGFAVFAFDYRGYGKSQGRPHEAGVVADGLAALDWLQQRTGLDAQQIVLLGRSLGGAVAVELAAQRGARALALESTFTNMPDVAARLFWWAPVRWLLRTRMDSLSRIAHYSGPVVQCHGALDTLVPLEIGMRLFRAIPGRKRFIEDAEGGHNTPPPPQYYQALLECLSEQDVATRP